ncbi:MAG: hypothetical protein HKN39_01440 [Flavobacteriales bacterium]|nr:hypothetical protein [Flavobacteriales bacterium]
MKFFERLYPFITAAIIIILVIYFSPTDLTGRYDPKKAMSSLDMDSNDELSNEEISELNDMLYTLDRDGDEKVTFTECTDHLDLARLLDRNKDEVIDKNEIAGSMEFLLSLDKDNNGSLTAKELK